MAVANGGVDGSIAILGNKQIKELIACFRARSDDKQKCGDKTYYKTAPAHGRRECIIAL